jgi:hypothetical protein
MDGHQVGGITSVPNHGFDANEPIVLLHKLLVFRPVIRDFMAALQFPFFRLEEGAKARSGRFSP